MSETADEAQQRYLAAMHGMQSGVAAKMGIDQSETTPKHLRVGINSSMSDHAALVMLLVDKGLFTEEEYMTAIANQMEIERNMYQDWLNHYYGFKDGSITLH